MASWSSWTPRNIPDRPTIRKMNDELYEVYKPAKGSVDLEIIFFHGFQSQDYNEAYLETWMSADGSECWINTWLAEDFPQARIMSVSYDSRTQVSASASGMDMHLVAENLAQSIIGLERTGESCPVVLVGHCIGGLVLKEMCLQAEEMGASDMSPAISPYKTFLWNMKGAFFYSTPNSGSRVTPSSKQNGPLLLYVELLSKDAARLNQRFSKLRQQHGWKTCGVGEASETEACQSIIQIPLSTISRFFSWQPQSALVVEEGSARQDIDDFCILSGEDHFTICKPRDRRSSNYVNLVEFIREVLQEERTKEVWLNSLRLPRVFVDIPRIVERVIGELQLGKAEPSQLTLVGMGGIGKTTLAKAVLMQIREQFDFSCFVEDVKDTLKRRNLDLHDLVANNLYTGSGRKVRLKDADALSLRLHLRGKKVLFIMDDVESEEQIMYLLDSRNWLRAGSRLIVTSRIGSRELLPTFSRCRVPFLSAEESQALFMAHLDADVARDIPSELIEKVVQNCDGLPLTLGVIGSYLHFEKGVLRWMSALDKLTKAEPLDGSAEDRLWAKLKVSFDELAPMERKMFLDVAVFDPCSQECNQETWKEVWETGDGFSVESGLKNLIDRFFIDLKIVLKIESGTTWSRVTIFWIHQQLRDLGKRISRPYNKRIELCRGVWKPDDVRYLLSVYKGDKADTEVISTSMDPPRISFAFQWSCVANLQELRLLRLSNVNFSGNTSRFPCKLIFIHLTSCSQDRGGTFQRLLRKDCWPIREEDVEGLQQLAGLHVENCKSVRFPSNFDRLSNLKILTVRGTPLKKLPKAFGRLPSLRVLSLANVGLSQLPSSFSQLSSLRTLSLEGCSLTATNTGFVPQLVRWGEQAPRPLSALTNLKLEDIRGLKELPESFWLLDSLENLKIARCSALKQLPVGFGKLSKLATLEIEDCYGLEYLCESLGELTSLLQLDIEDCPRLRNLPDSLGQLHSLTYLYLWNLNVVSLPETAGNLQNLQILNIMSLPYLQSLPENLGQLKSLKELWIWECDSFKCLPDSVGQLHELQEIKLSADRLGRLPETVGQLRKLRNMLLYCDNLENMPDSLGHLTSLEELTVSCQNLRDVPDSLGQLQNLEMLSFRRCERLEKLPRSLGQLQGLRLLELGPNIHPESLADSLRQLKALDELYVHLKYEPMLVEGTVTPVCHVMYSDE